MLAAAVVMWAASDAPDPAEVLASARAQMRETVRHLPKYTCTETVTRSYFTQPALGRLRCDEILGRRRTGQSKAKLAAIDRLRLDVAVEDSGREIFSWTGAARLDAEYLGELVGGGPIGTGPFGSFLVDIFANRGTTFTYQRQTNGLLEYRFQVPQAASHYQLQKGGRDGRFIGYDGMFWLDPEMAELRRLRVRTSELPESSGACEATTTVDFLRQHIGAGEYLIPRESQLSVIGRAGNESENTTSYSGCHEYRGESVLHFDDAESTEKPGAASQARDKILPADIGFELLLETPIDPATAAAGDPVSARVADRVVDPVDRKTLVPANAIARGRIIRMEQSVATPPSFLVAMKFETVEFNGTVVPLAAKLTETAWPGQKVRSGYSSNPTIFRSHSSFPLSGTFYFPLRKAGYVVPRGYRSRWVTVKPTVKPPLTSAPPSGS